MKKLIATTLIGATLLTSTTLYAQDASSTVSNAEMLSEIEAQTIALTQVDGVIEETELENEKGMKIYEVKISLADGSVTEVELDAMTGEILEVEADDEKGGFFDGLFGDDQDDDDDYEDDK